ncbi:MAG: hypothetical protein E7167_03990 [Firmicutes bacterium]|nr:hypothetical protein [Bacillota bacterium]
MKKRMPRQLILIVILCVLILAAILWLLIKNISSIDSSSEIVQEIYAYLGSDYLDYCEGMPFYEEDEINIESIDSSLKMCLAFKLIEENNILKESLNKDKKQDACNFTKEKQFRLSGNDDKCDIEIITSDILNAKYKNIFGTDIESYDDFKLSGSKICYYDEKEGRYLCGNTLVQNLQLGWAPTTYRMINKVKEKGNRIYIYDRYLAVNDSKCYVTNSGTSENEKCSDKINEKTNYNSLFLLRYGKQYTHIFEKDSKGDYHWISSSPEK